MRLLLSVLLGVLLAAACRAQAGDETSNPYDPLSGAPVPLAAALRQFARDAGRWAYTQRFVEYDRAGKVERSWVARYDPSQHYDVQWTLLATDDKEPTEAQQKRFRKQRAKREKDRKSLGELLELPQAVVAFQSSADLVYEVPLRLEDGSRFPPDKFQAFITVDRATQGLKLIDVKLREKLRVVGVVSVKSGDARLEFQRVLPDAGPAIAAISAGATASLLFVPVGGRIEAVRSDFKRVTPYDDRFQVKIGPLKTIDF